MLLGFFLVSIVLAASGGSAINDYLVDIRNTTLISVRSTARSSYRLDLSSLGLRQISKTAFTNATNIKILDLANNSIGSLNGSVFSSLGNLEHLSLADNVIDDFTGAFAGLENLKSLNISNNPFTVLKPGAFYGLNKTIDIFVLGNSLKKISTDVFDLDDWSRKTSTKNKDNNDKAPKSGRALNGDEEPQQRFKVCMNQGKVTILDKAMSDEVLQAGCSFLKDEEYTLQMTNLGIKEFERGWYRLPINQFIALITFSGNDIVRVTEEMLNDLPHSVLTVDLSNNKIERLDQGVIENSYITWFNLSSNLISEIEDGALSGMDLLELYLDDNRFKDMRFLSSLPPGLKRLTLNRNQIAEFTSDPLVKFRRLQTVELTDNRLTTLRNNSLRGLPPLLILDLSRNRIGTLEPGCFRNLTTMRILKLRDNEISDLDSGVFEDLSHIGRLDLGGNRLTRITEGFRNSLPSTLDNLDLDRNEIGSLENGTFVNVPKRRLNLENNRITTIAKGSFVVPELYGEDLEHERVDDFDSLDPLFTDNRLAEQVAAAGGFTPPTEPKGIGVVNLSGNPVGRLENGALFGLQRRMNNYVYVERNSIELIQGGLFDDGNQRTK